MVTHFAMMEWFLVFVFSLSSLFFCDHCIWIYFCYRTGNLSTYVLSAPTESDEEESGGTDDSISSSDWDVVLFLGLGCVGLWNALCFGFRYQSWICALPCVYIFLFYRNMTVSISIF